MWTKRILILLPIVVCLFLLQSYFWVPTYEQQARATPERLSQYIEGSIGDAQYLTPILYADNASGAIVAQVYEGLVDRDRDLNWRGRVAERWEITEEAYFVVNPTGAHTPEQAAGLIRSEQARRKGEDTPLGKAMANITEVAVEPAATITRKTQEKTGEDSDKKPKPVDVTITVKRPARIKLTLKDVDQDFFTTIEPVLGKGYFSSFTTAEDLISVSPAEFEKEKKRYAKEYLPATEHNPVIVFYLRHGVKFHDGHEVDSGDVKFMYDMFVDPRNASPSAPFFEPVKSVEAVDRYTVRVVYKELFAMGLQSWGNGIIPEHLLNEKARRAEAARRGIPFEEFDLRKAEFNQHPIGCGPFRFVQWKSDQYIELTRFDDYWDPPTMYKGYTYRIVPDQLTQEMEFYAGALDSYNVLPHQVARLEKDERFRAFSGVSFGYTYIGYNMRREPFKDKRVRRALGMAINVDEIIKYVLYGQAEQITGPFVKQTDFYDQGVPPVPYDPEGAKRLLAEAGWKLNKDGRLEKEGKVLRFRLMTNNGNDVRKAIMAIAQDSWKKIGVDVSTETVEWAVFLEKHVDQGDFDAIILGWGMGIDPDLYTVWHSSQSNPYQMNVCAFKNDEADKLIIRIRQEYDHARQVELCHKLHRIIADEQPYTFLYVGKWTALLDKRILVAVVDDKGKVIGYERIKPTKLGVYSYEFRRWVKLPRMPEKVME